MRIISDRLTPSATGGKTPVVHLPMYVEIDGRVFNIPDGEPVTIRSDAGRVQLVTFTVIAATVAHDKLPTRRPVLLARSLNRARLRAQHLANRRRRSSLAERPVARHTSSAARSAEVR